jgi:hypothetical protein
MEIAKMEDKMIRENQEKKLMQMMNEAPIAEHSSRKRRSVCR